MPEKKRYIQVENKNALLELIQDGQPFEKIFVASNAFRDPKTKKIMKEASDKGIPVERVTRQRMNRISRTSSVESVIGLKPAPLTKSLEEVLDERESKKPLLILILNNVRYGQNIGALLRTGYGASIDAVITTKKKKTHLTHEVTRISMGTSERIPMIEMNQFEAIKMLQDRGVKIVGVHMAGKPYYKADLKYDVALVLGSEDEGVSSRMLERCDDIVTIPMQEGIGSLNVSATGAIVMFEKRRQDG